MVQKVQNPYDFAVSLSKKIKGFQAFNDNFLPLSDDVKRTMFKDQRTIGWPVLRRAILILDQQSRVGMFYRPPLQDNKDAAIKSSGSDIPPKPESTYGLVAHNSIVVCGMATTDFKDIATQTIQGWPENTRIILAGMAYGKVLEYHYFFEVGYAVMHHTADMKVMGKSVNFVELEKAIDIMKSQGLEYKDMEIHIIQALARKDRDYPKK